MFVQIKLHNKELYCKSYLMNLGNEELELKIV